MAEPEKYKLKDGKIKWKFRVYLGINPKTGKQQYTNRQGFDTKGEANIVLKRIENEVAEGIYFNEKKKIATNLTFKEVYEEWLDKDYKRSVRPPTLLVTERLFENRILPAIGDYKINKVSRGDIQKLADQWGKHESCKKWINFIKRVYKYARRENYTTNDPAQYVVVPKPKKPELRKKFYETSELEQFIKELEDYDILQAQAFLRILFFTGLRRGELLALKWKYVDFEEQTIQVEHSTERVKDEKTGKSYMRIGPPKNDASYRTIDIDDKTFEYFHELYKYKMNGLVFTSQHGGLLSDSKPRKWLRSVAKRAKIEPIAVHHSRHTHASLLFEAGATVKDVQKRLGHEKVSTTMDIYTHVTEQSTKRLGQKFSDYLDF